LPVRAGRGARTRRIVTRGGGLRGGRHEGARGLTRALDRRDASQVEAIMPLKTAMPAYLKLTPLGPTSLDSVPRL
jgi:hypothetical protein